MPRSVACRPLTTDHARRLRPSSVACIDPGPGVRSGAWPDAGIRASLQILEKIPEDVITVLQSLHPFHKAAISGDFVETVPPRQILRGGVAADCASAERLPRMALRGLAGVIGVAMETWAGPAVAAAAVDSTCPCCP